MFGLSKKRLTMIDHVKSNVIFPSHGKVAQTIDKQLKYTNGKMVVIDTDTRLTSSL